MQLVLILIAYNHIICLYLRTIFGKNSCYCQSATREEFMILQKNIYPCSSEISLMANFVNSGDIWMKFCIETFLIENEHLGLVRWSNGPSFHPSISHNKYQIVISQRICVKFGRDVPNSPGFIK